MAVRCRKSLTVADCWHAILSLSVSLWHEAKKRDYELSDVIGLLLTVAATVAEYVNAFCYHSARDIRVVNTTFRLFVGRPQ